MNFELKALNLSSAAAAKCDLLLLLVPESFKPQQDPLSALVRSALKHGDWSQASGKQLHLYQPQGVQARRVLLVGVGEGQVRDVRAALTGAGALLKAEGVKHAMICLSAMAGAQEQEAVRAVVQCVSDVSYVYTLTKPQAKACALSKVTVGVEDKRAHAQVFEQTVAVALGQALAKEWGNRPANHATPSLLSKAAKELAQHAQIECKVHGPKEVAKLGMGAFLAVAQGSKEPLQFIELSYNGAAKSQAPVVLVGKGITFDTGGISLKPAAAMDEMKFDMCGAASVLGVFRALAELKPAINVVGLIPACENMPDGAAVKPGDVVTSMSGQTIEILNTDAEGRLVLCDTLTYATRFKPSAVIDIATLTGACVIALGGVRSGMYANQDSLGLALQQAGEKSHDLCWRMPLDDDYAEGLKSNFADVGNVAGRAGGSITAAKFLQRFVADMAWAHLDIAGTAWKEGAAKGATGRPVPLLVQYLLDVAQQPAAKVPKASTAVKRMRKPAAKTEGLQVKAPVKAPQV
ncbi:leucyl aminopeptidase [Comamonas sp. NoAH]|uniref:leucyl aminopeptidase n=1 Tax=Comamonas halotolerans TaxID=3041496 RepID=UPI0024E17C73|nr:leucyl aminopeptidase [Comamonas sp. NoAH]